MAEYERLKRAYSATVELLFSVGYRATDDEYRQMKAAAEDARFELENARRKMKALDPSRTTQ